MTTIEYTATRARVDFLRILRDSYLDTARNLAGRARRARLAADLDLIRDIGQQLNALDPASPEAPDVLTVAGHMLTVRAHELGRAGA